MLLRKDVPQEDQWDLTALFASFEDFEEAYKEVLEGAEKGKVNWPLLQTFKGKLTQSPQDLRSFLENCLSIERKIEKLYTYAHLRHDEDLRNDENKGWFNKTLSLYHDFSHETSWVEPELLSADQKTLDALLRDTHLSEYAFYLEKIIKKKPHTLSKEQESLMALASKSLQTSYKTFSSLNNSDFRFGKILDSKGNEYELTHATYQLYLRDTDRTLRANAFNRMHQRFKEYENTLAELLNGQVEAHVFQARARNFSSCVEQALFRNDIPVEVYHSLISSVHEGLPALHKYNSLRKKILGVDELHLYDMYAPLVDEAEFRFTYEEAEDLVIESVAPLGQEYQDILARGLKEERWADRYENENKRSGAYSSGCFDSHPYMLMNFQGTLNDVFTLAHEAGHSMHSYYSRKNQKYHYSDYSIFVAEVASTFNEELLMQSLLKKRTRENEVLYLVNQKIEDIRGTLFRQAMFAEFELYVHEEVMGGNALTPSHLRTKYLELISRYFGEETCIDPEIEVEWARIPHFYYNFYVYQYATGISAALALTQGVLEGGEKELSAYLGFLKGGSSQYPIDLLRSAGVDMLTRDPVQKAVERFTQLVETLESKTQRGLVGSK